jgi:hypothetical protein
MTLSATSLYRNDKEEEDRKGNASKEMIFLNFVQIGSEEGSADVC